MEISLTQQALLYLLNCAVNERIPEELPHDVDFEGLYKISKFHSVSAMVSCALDKGGYLSEAYMSQELIQKWVMARIHAMRKNLMFDAERAQILQHLEDIGCWYMPLKGVILKELYPDVGMREMCDNDILVDENFRIKIKDYMVDRGYEIYEFEKSVHDSYVKKPFYHFEFHIELFNKHISAKRADYYENIKERLCKDKENSFGYHFKDEDFYVYVTAHACKHYKGGGTGIRSFVDTYVYLKKKGKNLDWKYINQEVKKVGIASYEEEIRKLAKKLFNKVSKYSDLYLNDEKDMVMLSYILGSGTYGTLNNRLKNKIIALQNDDTQITFRSKVKFFMCRLFPGLDYMKAFKPFLYKHKYLIPFFWIYRLFTAPIINRKRIFAEIRTLIKVK